MMFLQVRRRCRHYVPVAHRFRSISAYMDHEFKHLVDESQISPYWLKELNLISKPSARNLIAQLVGSNPLGFESPNGRAKKGTFLEFAINQKINHPDKVILLRSGEFYETYGIDAIMMVNHSGLNPMGGKCKAGCPVKNVQATLDGLTEAGLSVAVFEEISGVELTSKAKIKQRYLSQVVSPLMSTYAYDLCLRPDNVEFRTNKPIVAILETVNGFNMYEVYIDGQTISVSTQQTAEAIIASLSLTGCAEPVYIQCDPAKRPSCFDSIQLELLYNLDSSNFQQNVLSTIGHNLHINTNEFRIKCRSYDSGPRPLYTSTALQIGLLANPCVPDLLPELLPMKQSPAYCERFLRRWLLQPPSAELSTQMQLLCSALAQMKSTLPVSVVVKEGKLVQLLTTGQCNVVLFQEIFANMNMVINMLSLALHEASTIQVLDLGNDNSDINHALSHSQLQYSSHEFACIVQHLLPIVQEESGVACSPWLLMTHCSRVRDAIIQVVATHSESASLDKHSTDRYQNIPDDFFARNECEFRGKLLCTIPNINELYENIRTAAEELCAAVQTDYATNEIVFDILNNLLLLKNKPGTARLKKGKQAKLAPDSSTDISLITFAPHLDVSTATTAPIYIHPIDRNYATISNRYTTVAVQDALKKYLCLVHKAPDIISQALQNLSTTLLPHLAAVVQSSHFAAILQAVNLHVVSSLQKGWCLPTVMNDHKDNKLQSLVMNGLTPYWLPRHSAVANDVTLQGLNILTAPNMSGKSTMMRAATVAALLGNCGLFVPCCSAVIPRYDSFFLRTASYDVPSEHKSAFAVEMEDVAVMLRDSTRHSLLMMDEIGKGTSSRDGAALAGALLEHLDTLQTTSIFATHLYEIFELPLQLSASVNYKKMGLSAAVADAPPQWSYLLEDGVCTDSLATLTARQYGVPLSILDRAAQLVNLMDSSSSSQSSARVGFATNQTLPPAPQRVHINEELLKEAIRTVYLAAAGAGAPCGDIVVIAQDTLPPAHLESSACVYVLTVQSALNNQSPVIVYVGETASISQRLHQHRQSRRGSRVLSCLALSVRDKSTARLLETSLALHLHKLGVVLESSKDLHHKLFGNLPSN